MLDLRLVSKFFLTSVSRRDEYTLRNEESARRRSPLTVVGDSVIYVENTRSIGVRIERRIAGLTAEDTS